MKKQLFLILSIFVFVFALAGCKKALSTTTYNVETEVKKVTLEDSACDVTIKSTEEENLYFEYSEIEGKYTYVITMNNQTGSLVVRRKDSRKGFVKGTFTTTPKTIVYVPETYEIEIDVKVNVGNIKLEDVNLTSGKVELTSGNINIDDIETSGALELKSTAGNIEVSNSIINDFSSDLHSGSYDVKSSTFAEKVKLVGYASSVTLENITSDNINVEVTTGDVEYFNAEVKKALNITVTTGDIDISLNGKKSDYTLTKKTGMGENETIGVGAFAVNLSTTVGTINVTYLK